MSFKLEGCFYNILNRSIISVAGLEASDFLQSIITNDIKIVSDSKTIYSCLLSPQGKFNYDFFVSYINDQYVLDIDATQADSLIKKLNLYKLRKKIDIKYEPNYIVLNLYNNENIDSKDFLGYTVNYLSGVIYIDPRSYLMNYRAIITKTDFENVKTTLKQGDSYDMLRINSVIPEGTTDLIFDKSFPLEFGFDRINAISFSKGCYVGQEVISRTKYRGVIRKKIYKVIADFNLFKNDEIYIAESKIGYITSALNNIGIALIREEDYNNLNIGNNNFPVIKTNKVKLIKQ